MKIRSATKEDVVAMVCVHLDSFPGFFLTFLGPRFLRVLYSSILDAPENISLVALDDEDTVVGFAVGTFSPKGLYKRLLLHNWFDFGLASVLPALRNPACIPRLIRAFSSPRSESSHQADCLLMSIGVVSRRVGTGLGRLLLQQFLEIAEKRGAHAVSLTTDKENNEDVNRFYLNAGFKLHRSFATPENRQMNEYLYVVTSSP